LAFPELDQLLARYPAHLQPRSELESLGGAGGFSGSRFWRYRAAAGQLVLRSWPPGWRGRSELERIHRWLFLTADTGLTPVPFRDNGARSLQQFQGCFWELTPWLPGLADSANPPAVEHLEAAFSGLAALHVRLACESRVGVSPGLEQRRVTVEHLIDGGFDTIEAAVAHQATSPGEAAAAGRWLSLARSAAPRVSELLGRVSRSVLLLQPCLRDARPDHFLFEGGRLSGIVDFGAMGVDSVAGDLARLIGEWQGGDPAAGARAQKAYERIRPLQPVEISLISVFLSSADLLIGERWLRWYYLEGRRFEDPEAVSHGLARGLRRLERLKLSTRALASE
jgi:Ser/Thr protein kinase RdoA (MazF antagonist)